MSDGVDRTVFVVAANYADDPHPHVEAVYGNEEAAEEHRRAIQQSTGPSGPVAWHVLEREIHEEPQDERDYKVVP